MVKNSPANAGDIRDTGLIPALGRSSGGENGNPLQYSCLENPMDRRAWQATVHKIARVGHDWSINISYGRMWDLVRDNDGKNVKQINLGCKMCFKHMIQSVHLMQGKIELLKTKYRIERVLSRKHKKWIFYGIQFNYCVYWHFLFCLQFFMRCKWYQERKMQRFNV